MQLIVLKTTPMKTKFLLATVALLIIGVNFCVGQTAYVTNEGDNSVSVINVSTNTVTATIPVGTYPAGVSVSQDGTKVYVTNQNDNTVSVINTATNTVSATITVGVNPQTLCVTPDGSKVYVSNQNDNTVSVINTATDTVSATIPVGGNPEGVSVSPDGSKVYVANVNSNTVSVINAFANTVSATITVGSHPDATSMRPDGHYVYVTNQDDNTVSVINTATKTVSATISVGQGPDGITTSPNGTSVYVANYYGHTISVINTVTNTVSATIYVGTSPYGVSITPDGSLVYVANWSSAGTVKVIDTFTDSVLATIIVGHSPVAFGNFISSFPTIIITDSVATSICAGNTISVPFTTSDTLNNGNIFTAQLSNASGSFANPVSIGTLTDTIAGTITATIPTNTPAGNGYRIRIVSSNPVVTGTDNGSNITVYPTYSNTVSASICHGSIYTFPDGTMDSAATVYTSNLSSINSCDSVITTNLSVITPNVGIHYTGTTCGCGSFWLQVDSMATSYQWINCNTSDSIITGETNNYYAPLLDGNYACIINQNGCIDTSACYYVLGDGVTNLAAADDITIAPNPFTDETTITFSEEQKNTLIKITDIVGKEIKSVILSAARNLNIEKGEMSNGIYFVQIINEKGIVNKKIVVQ